MTISKKFQDELGDKLEELYPKGHKGRGEALVFNAFANIIFRSKFTELLESLRMKEEEEYKDEENELKTMTYVRGSHKGYNIAIQEINKRIDLLLK